MVAPLADGKIEARQIAAEGGIALALRGLVGMSALQDFRIGEDGFLGRALQRGGLCLSQQGTQGQAQDDDFAMHYFGGQLLAVLFFNCE